MSNIQHNHARYNNRSPTYNSWSSMRDRCNNENAPMYYLYGARGITVCERWDSFQNFLDDMGERPDGLTLDRINNEEGYSKENCKWSTPTEQGENRRTTIIDQTDATAVCLARMYGKTTSDIAAQFGISHSYVRNLWAGNARVGAYEVAELIYEDGARNDPDWTSGEYTGVEARAQAAR